MFALYCLMSSNYRDEFVRFFRVSPENRVWSWLRKYFGEFFECLRAFKDKTLSRSDPTEVSTLIIKNTGGQPGTVETRIVPANKLSGCAPVIDACCTAVDEEEEGEENMIEMQLQMLDSEDAMETLL